MPQMPDPVSTETLHPQLVALIAARAPMRNARVLDATVLREQASAAVDLVNAGSPAIAERREIVIPRAHGGGSIRTILLRPETEQPLGLCIYFPGGGFVICNPETHEKIARVIANEAPALVVSVDYRKAPEHPFPSAMEDALEAVEWLIEMRDVLGALRDAVILAGDSSGGNLATGVTQRRIAGGQRPADGLLLFYPWVDLGRNSQSRRRLGPDDFLIDDEYMDYLTSCYVPAGRVEDPDVSPLFGDFTGFPPTVVVCGTRDPLLSDSQRLVSRLQAAGSPVEWQPFEGMPHGFVSMNNYLDPGAEALHLGAQSAGKLMKRKHTQ
jgi:acetyl esterase